MTGSGAISTTSGVSTASFSSAFTAPAAGTYYWLRQLCGRLREQCVSRPPVAAANEVIAVGKASPSITTQASPTLPITVGTASTVGDTATFQTTTLGGTDGVGDVHVVHG